MYDMIIIVMVLGIIYLVFKQVFAGLKAILNGIYNIIMKLIK